MSWDWQIGVTGDAEIRARLAPDRQIADLLRVEAAFSRALGVVGVVPSELAAKAARAIEMAELDRERLVTDALRDGMPVPGLVRQLKEMMPTELHRALHQGLTSQDVMDTALMLAVSDCLSVLEARLHRIDGRLLTLSKDVGDQPLMARTRMQAALPVTLARRIDAWRAPLTGHLAVLDGLRQRVCVVQLGGPVGTSEGFGTAREPLCAALAAELGLAPAPVWHTDRSRIMELGAWLSRVSGSLGKMGHDIALMAQQGVNEVRLPAGGRSSAMEHKTNPVKAEVLVALGRDASVQLGALHLAMDHEQERSGAAWTLEWLVLPRLLEGAGAGLLQAEALLEDLEFPRPELG
ncbi:MAG: lyase family protein [Pseudomonadota bacterium]